MLENCGYRFPIRRHEVTWWGFSEPLESLIDDCGPWCTGQGTSPDRNKGIHVVSSVILEFCLFLFFVSKFLLMILSFCQNWQLATVQRALKLYRRRVATLWPNLHPWWQTLSDGERIYMYNNQTPCTCRALARTLQAQYSKKYHNQVHLLKKFGTRPNLTFF